MNRLAKLPDLCLDLIYGRLHQMCMREIRNELCGATEHFFWLPRDADTDTDETYSCVSSSESESDD